MQYKTITYKRIKNLQDYNSEHLELSAELEKGDDVVEKSDYIRKVVNEILEMPTQKEDTSDIYAGF